MRLRNYSNKQKPNSAELGFLFLLDPINGGWDKGLIPTVTKIVDRHVLVDGESVTYPFRALYIEAEIG